MGIQEGRWDCTYCGTRGILGRLMACPNCGQRRPEDIKFYLPEDAPDISDEEQLKRAKAGPDWICEYCGASNSAIEQVCTQCGAERSEAVSQEVKEYSLEERPHFGDEGPAPDAADDPYADTPYAVEQSYTASFLDDDEPSSSPPAPNEPEEEGSKKKWFKPFAIVAAIIVACIMPALFFFLMPQTVEAQVSGVEWERSIDVEVYKTVVEEDWSVPSGGRRLDSWREVHHHEEVIDHYETKTREVSEKVKVGTERYKCGTRDLGNGYFEDKYCTRDKYETRYRTETYEEPVYRKEPVYQTKYRYEIDKWVHDRTREEEGTDYNPQWPRVSIGKNEREGEREEEYTVYFVGKKKGKTYEVDLPFEEWKTYKEGQTHKLKINRLGKVEILD